MAAEFHNKVLGVSDESCSGFIFSSTMQPRKNEERPTQIDIHTIRTFLTIVTTVTIVGASVPRPQQQNGRSQGLAASSMIMAKGDV